MCSRRSVARLSEVDGGLLRARARAEEASCRGVMSTCEDSGEYFEPSELWPTEPFMRRDCKTCCKNHFSVTVFDEKTALGRCSGGMRVLTVYAEGGVRSR
jgi:hypothetical protein